MRHGAQRPALHERAPRRVRSSARRTTPPDVSRSARSRCPLTHERRDRVVARGRSGGDSETVAVGRGSIHHGSGVPLRELPVEVSDGGVAERDSDTRRGQEGQDDLGIPPWPIGPFDLQAVPSSISVSWLLISLLIRPECRERERASRAPEARKVPSRRVACPACPTERLLAPFGAPQKCEFIEILWCIAGLKSA